MSNIENFFRRRVRKNKDSLKILKEKRISMKICKNESKLKDELNNLRNETVITGCRFSKRYCKKLGIFKYVFPVKGEYFSEVFRVMKKVNGKIVLGMGGGRTLDVAKMVSFQTGKKLVLIPTAPTHDGLISRNSALIVNGVKRSYPTKFPQKIIIPEYLWNLSNPLKNFGELDIIGNIVALEDVSLAMEEVNFRPEKNYMNLSILAVKNVLMDSTRGLAEAVFLSGLAMENSSRYCSGAEHELEKIMTKKFGKKRRLFCSYRGGYRGD